MSALPPALSPESRAENMRRLRGEPFDVLILGGGINGAGLARDLTMRAVRSGVDLRVALVEKGHFASGTSGKNSQLIHGGLRYLKSLEFSLVREALRERSTLLELAPHLVEPLSFLIPMYGWFPRLFYGTGLWLYDLLAGAHVVDRHRGLSREEIARVEPGLATEGLTSGAVFFDCRVHSARFVLENVFDAARWGACVVNYASGEHVASGLARITDRLGGPPFELRARKIVDATGPWSGAGLRLVRGSHIVLPRLNASEHAIAYFEPDGRIIFVIPWGSGRRFSLVGTTDVDHTGPDDVHISDDEVRYLLGVVHRLFPGAAGVEPVSTFSSLRPLIAQDEANPTRVSRGHRIWNDPDGVLHIAGGKYTTYRAMSEEAADAIAREIAPTLAAVHPTAREPLGGNSRERIDELMNSAGELAERYSIESGEIREIVREYGVQSGNLLAYLPQSTAQLPAEPLTRVESARIAFAVRHEMAQHLADVMFVSTYWGHERRWTEESLEPYAREMGRHLGWDEGRIRVECDRQAYGPRR